MKRISYYILVTRQVPVRRGRETVMVPWPCLEQVKGYPVNEFFAVRQLGLFLWRVDHLQSGHCVGPDEHKKEEAERNALLLTRAGGPRFWTTQWFTHQFHPAFAAVKRRFDRERRLGKGSGNDHPR